MSPQMPAQQPQQQQQQGMGPPPLPASNRFFDLMRSGIPAKPKGYVRGGSVGLGTLGILDMAPMGILGYTGGYDPEEVEMAKIRKVSPVAPNIPSGEMYLHETKDPKGDQIGLFNQFTGREPEPEYTAGTGKAAETGGIYTPEYGPDLYSPVIGQIQSLVQKGLGDVGSLAKKELIDPALGYLKEDIYKPAKEWILEPPKGGATVFAPGIDEFGDAPALPAAAAPSATVLPSAAAVLPTVTVPDPGPLAKMDYIDEALHTEAVADPSFDPDYMDPLDAALHKEFFPDPSPFEQHFMGPGGVGGIDLAKAGKVSGMQGLQAGLTAAMMKNAGASDREIAEYVGTKFGVQQAVKVANLNPLVASPVSAVVSDLILNKGKIGAGTAGSVVQGIVGAGIKTAVTNAAIAQATQAAMASGASAGQALATGAAAGASGFTPYIAGAAALAPAAIMAAAGIQGAQRDALRGKRQAEQQAYTAPIKGLQPDLDSIAANRGWSGQEIEALFKKEPYGNYDWEMGKNLVDSIGYDLHGDERVWKRQVSEFGQIAKYNREVPAHQEAWDRLIRGEITPSEFDSLGQKAIDDFVVSKLGARRTVDPRKEVLFRGRYVNPQHYFEQSGRVPSGFRRIYGEEEGDTIVNIAEEREKAAAKVKAASMMTQTEWDDYYNPGD